MKHKIFGIVIIVLLCIQFVFCGALFVRQFIDERRSEETFDNLSDLVSNNPTSQPEINPSPESEESIEADPVFDKYHTIYEKNNDFIGWISIPGTSIDHPVMQTPNDPNFYLKHSFDKTYSDYGVPYVDGKCSLGLSNNTVIYGHHMRNDSMFSDLCKYTDKSFWTEFPYVEFDTLNHTGTYRIIAVFKYDTNSETFKYNECVDMNEEEFSQFMKEVHSRQLYDTGWTAEYGDELLTLSTCEYTYKNGRFVVIAKKVV